VENSKNRPGPDPNVRTNCRYARWANVYTFPASKYTQMRFVAGQLALPYAKKDKTYGVMLFDRRPIQ
jgi:hypothetical protein